MFFTLLLIFSLNTFGEPRVTKFLYVKRLEEIVKDVSLLTLGSLGNTLLAMDVGRYVGSVVKSLGYSYYLLGPLDTLSSDDSDYYYRVHKSPYITADIYDKFALGLSNAGVIAVFDGRGKIDTNLVSSLITRKLTYPVLVEEEAKANLLKTLGYKGVFIIENDGEYAFFNSFPIKLYWSIEILDIEALRKRVLLNSIIYLSPGKIQVKVPFATSGVVVYSDDDFVLEEAKKVLEKRAGPGRVPW